jgi:eukaryotic-like serine/threonine-protein kinase
VSDNDTLVYLERSAAMRQLTIRDRSGRKTAVIGAPAQELRYPVLSPDGTRVTFSADEGFSRHIWIAEVDRPIKTRVTFETGDSGRVDFYDYPTWSPAGDRIAYFAFVVPEQYSIRSKAADGSGAEVTLLKSSAFPGLSQWYKSDRMLLYRRDPQSVNTRLEFVSVGGSGAQTDPPNKPEVLPYSEQGARVSPDGGLLALVSNQSGQNEVYVRSMNQSTGGKRVSERGANQPRWRSDGKELYYSEGNSIMAVSVSTSGGTITLGRPQLLFTIEGGVQSGYAVWPDGQRFLFPEQAEGSRPPLIRVVQNWSAAFGSKRTE